MYMTGANNMATSWLHLVQPTLCLPAKSDKLKEWVDGETEWISKHWEVMLNTPLMALSGLYEEIQSSNIQ